MASRTNLGRVQPVYRGTYTSETTYYKLDNVFYNGNTYVCKEEGIYNINPVESDSWQLVAGKGEMGSIASVCVANFVEAGAEAGWASAELSGEIGSQSIAFSFGIPAGPTGDAAAIASIEVTSTVLDDVSVPSVGVRFSGGVAAMATFDFGFPATAANVKTIDSYGVGQSTVGNVMLTAVQYGRTLSLNPDERKTARTNIAAAACPTTVPGADNVFIKYDSLGNPNYTTIREVPVGGLNGNILVMNDSTYQWATPDLGLPSITNAEIDTIVNS